MRSEIEFSQHLSELRCSNFPGFVLRPSGLLLPGVCVELLLQTLYLAAKVLDNVPLSLPGPHPLQYDRQLGGQPPRVLGSLPDIRGGDLGPDVPRAHEEEEKKEWGREHF